MMDTFVCKIVVIDCTEHKQLRPKKVDNSKSARTSIKKCLFGVADAVTTEKMVQEQYDIDRKRFIDRFGIDLEHVKKLESTLDRDDNEENINSEINCAVNRKSCLQGRKILKGQRKVLKLISPQHVITDFYQARKNVQSQEKNTKCSKEN